MSETTLEMLPEQEALAALALVCSSADHKRVCNEAVVLIQHLREENERLAEKRAPQSFSTVRENVCWWLNVIAEELEGDSTLLPCDTLQDGIDWLRTAASSDTKEEG